MVRAAAKNHAHVGIVIDPSRLRRGAGRAALDRLALARRPVVGSPATRSPTPRPTTPRSSPGSTPACPPRATRGPASADAPAELPATIELTLDRAQVLRYGENPHQVGARYTTRGEQGWWATAVQHGGKEMCYLNVYDTEAAWQLVHSLGDGPAAVVIKHANPCGAAVADDILTAYTRAHECDPVSAYGGIVAVNRPVTMAVAEAIQPVFTEVLVAPAYDADALAFLKEKKKNLRILEAAAPAVPELSTAGRRRRLPGADRRPRHRRPGAVAGRHRAPADRGRVGRPRAGVAGGRQGDVQRHRAGEGRHRPSASAAASRTAATPVGSRVRRPPAGPRAASTPPTPSSRSPTGSKGAIEAGATVVVQPGGSIRDDEVIAAANEAGLAMVFTGERHFRH